MENGEENGLPQYQVELEAIGQGIRDFEEGKGDNIALISEPFAGRSNPITREEIHIRNSEPPW